MIAIWFLNAVRNFGILLPFSGVCYTRIGQHHSLKNHGFRYLSCTCHQWPVGRLWHTNQQI